MKSLLFLAVILGSISNVVFSAPLKPQKSKSPTYKTEQKTEWMLKKLLVLSQKKPQVLVRFSEQLLHPNRVRQSTIDIKKAHEWQHRLAAVNALGDLFRKRNRNQVQATYKQKALARTLILQTLKSDPALLVRDGAAETIRRIILSNPEEFHSNKEWKLSLESSFLDGKNSIDGEGLFIKETILTALKESKRPLSKHISKNAKSDKNKNLRKLL